MASCLVFHKSLSSRCQGHTQGSPYTLKKICLKGQFPCVPPPPIHYGKKMFEGGTLCTPLTVTCEDPVRTSLKCFLRTAGRFSKDTLRTSWWKVGSIVKQLPQQHVVLLQTQTHVQNSHLGNCHLGNGPWKIALGKMPLGKYLTPYLQLI